MAGVSIENFALLIRRDVYAVQVAGELRDRIAVGTNDLQIELEEIEALGLPLVNYFIKYPGHRASDMGIFPDE
ncbi:MAG: hypothetical protein AAB768_02605 [Patescibacteria group bacterium]